MQNSNGVTLYHKNLDKKSKGQILSLAMNCYSHVVEGQRTFKEWAEKIAKNYDLKDQRNLVIYTTVKNTEGIIENYKFMQQTKIRYKNL